MGDSKILIVDDDRDFAASLAEYLELDGHEVGVAYSGRGGIQAMNADGYTHIIVDVGLPDLNGVECMNAMRRVNPDVRILLITGYSANQLDRMVTVPSDVEVLTKPLDLEQLSQRLAGSRRASPRRD